MQNQLIKHFYCVVPDKLLAGEYPRNIDEPSSQEKIDDLLGSGVTAFIDLTEEREGLRPYVSLIHRASHQRFPIRDMSIPKSAETTQAILDAIDHGIEHDQKIYVH